MRIVKLMTAILLLCIHGFSLGQRYKTVKIGDQIWMAENLKVTHYRNGDPIPQVKSPYYWAKLTTGAWCYYRNNSGNNYKHGRLYNWYAVNDPRGLAQDGWHVPTDEEWKKLEMTLGMSQTEANKGLDRGSSGVGGKLKGIGTYYWHKPNKDATNESGFSAFGDGSRSTDGYFYNLGDSAYFWSSTEYSTDGAWGRNLNCNNSKIGRSVRNKLHGFSVRCVKDPVIDQDDLEQAQVKPVYHEPVPPKDEGTSIVLKYDEVPKIIGGWGELTKNLVYPPMARKAKIEGTVIVNAVIDEKGNVGETSISKSLKGCDDAAVEAIKKTKWKPAMYRNQPVKVRVAIPVVFKLN